MMRNRCCPLSAALRRAALSALLAIASIALPSLAPTSASAQVLIPAETLASEADLTQALEQGRTLESQQRWGEALAHYEEAVREFPERADLWERLTRARVHYDLDRRYEDRSFLQSLTQLNEATALDLYGEILTKIGTHYVQPPDWQALARRGLANVDVGLMRPAFRQRNAVRATDEQIRAFLENIHRRMDVTVVRSREQAREVAANVARAASQQLGLSPVATILEFTCGATCSLDQYSCFLTGSQLSDTFSQIEGNFVGLGIELRAQQQSLEIVSVISGSPAQQAGIRPGDRIVEVDSTPTDRISTDEAADLLKGPEGSSTELRLIDPQGASRRLRLLRRRVEVPSIDNAHIADAEYGVAYLKLSTFQKTTSRDMDAALWNLHSQGMQTLIIDLRGNPGGLLDAAVEVADKFVANGNLVSTRGRNAHEDCDYQAHALGTWRVPLLVLIDADTASASEIFAGAIRDHQRGTVVGQRSYGKGSVQGIFRLNTSEAGVRLTTAKFYSPSGQPISDRGVSPDLIVQSVQKPVATGDSVGTAAEDAALQAAVQHVRSSRQQTLQQARAR